MRCARLPHAELHVGQRAPGRVRARHAGARDARAHRGPLRRLRCALLPAHSQDGAGRAGGEVRRRRPAFRGTARRLPRPRGRGHHAGHADDRRPQPGLRRLQHRLPQGTRVGGARTARTHGAAGVRPPGLDHGEERSRGRGPADGRLSQAEGVLTMEHVDAVVVGSGFGGSVAAYRLAEAGKSVVVMERGRDYPPGGFARTPAQMSRAFWDPREGLYGIFDVWSFRGLDSVVSSGLGGGSLIYANVLLRKDEHWFVNEQPPPTGGYQPWPVSRADLDPHYDEVQRMLGATPYPFEKPAYADTPKTHAMQDAAVELGLGWSLPPLAVSFAPERGAEPGIGLPIVEPEYGNLHGVPRRTCQLCGECNIGCNDGSKNSLDHNYLSAAKHHGADLRTLHDVRGIRLRPGGGYEVDYVRHDPARRSRRPQSHTIGCDRLVLAAGTYGTSYLLLRNRRNLPGLSQALGTRFCGNGDLLTFLLKASDRDRVRPPHA